MPTDKFLIAPFKTGFKYNQVPWMEPKDAFLTMRNAYVWRDRVVKRFGSMYLLSEVSTGEYGHLRSRLRMQLTLSTGASPQVITLNSLTPAITGPFNDGLGFSVGNIFFTYTGALQLLSTDPAVSATFDSATTVLTITGYGAIGDPIFFYPALPVMGLPDFLETGNNTLITLVGFDTRFAYRYVPGVGWERLGTATWQGNDRQLFWAENYEGTDDENTYLYVTNFNVTKNQFQAGAGPYFPNDDPIRRWTGSTWVDFAPYFAPTGSPNTGPQLVGARILIGFQNHLIALNTVEQFAVTEDMQAGRRNRWFKNRARYSKLGTALDANSWYQLNTTDGTNVAQGGGFVDAYTEEEIRTAYLLQNRLIVECDNSTWELVYQGVKNLPFIWQKLSSELGSFSTFSSVGFDKEVLSIGATGIHSCNGQYVQRIDQNIPDEVFKIEDKVVQSQRIVGIRDFYTEMVYWAMPTLYDDDSTTEYPNKVLCYNYLNGSWSYNDDTITAFGYIAQESDWTWASQGNETWSSLGNSTWTSGLQQSNTREIVMGNQQGFTFVLNNEATTNANVLQITDITITDDYEAVLLIHNHNLQSGEYIEIDYAQGVSGFNGNIFEVDKIDDDLVEIKVADNSTVFSGTYTGNGMVARVSNIDIKSKWWNPYIKDDANVMFPRMVFGVQRTEQGAFTVDYYTSSSEQSTIDSGQEFTLANGVVHTSPYTNTLPNESTYRLVWHNLYMKARGSFIQIRMFYKDDPTDYAETQIRNPNIIAEPFVLEGIVIHAQRSSSQLR